MPYPSPEYPSDETCDCVYISEDLVDASTCPVHGKQTPLPDDDNAGRYGNPDVPYTVKEDSDNEIARRDSLAFILKEADRDVEF